MPRSYEGTGAVTGARRAEALRELTLTEDATRLVKLLADARRLCWQLLGPPPERRDKFSRHPDGTPRERPLAKGEPASPVPKKRSRRKK